MNSGRAVLGGAFVAVGLLALLDQLDVLEAGPIVADWWPVAFLAAAVLDLLARPPRVASAAVLGVLGVVLLAVTTGILGTSVLAVLWPLAIVALGVWLILRRPTRAVSGDAQDRIETFALLSGRRVVPTSSTFRGGSVTAVLGGVEVDLTGVGLAPGAVLDAVAVLGGVDVEVPPGWRVVLDGPAILGGHESHVPVPADPSAPTLTVRATAVLGGVEVDVASGATWPTGPVPTA